MIQPGNSYYEAARAFLIKLGVPLTRSNVNVVVAWEWCEKPHPDGAWQWNNPLNTTRNCCNWVRITNSAGVKEYPTKNDGIEACVQTIRLSYYKAMHRALMENNPHAFLAAENEIGTWGTNPGCIASVYASLPPPPDWALEPVEPPPPPPPPPVPVPLLLSPIVAIAGAVLFGGAGAGLVVFANRERIGKWWYNIVGR